MDMTFFSRSLTVLVGDIPASASKTPQQALGWGKQNLR